MTPPAPDATCPNCGKPIPATGFCPNCGASPPPLPVLTNEPDSQQAVNARLLTNSRGGDIALGDVLGVLFPPLLFVVLTAFINELSKSYASVGFGVIALALYLPVVIGVPLATASALKRRWHVAGNAMQKILFGWLILLGLVLLGLFVMCAVGGFKI